MQISRSEEYAIRGLIFLARQSPGKMTLLSEISRVQKIPERFLAKIFQRLSKEGLLRSVRGSKGGFALAKPATEITMREVIEALDGPIAINRCLRQSGECEEEKICPLHQVFEQAQNRFLEVLGKTTIDDLATKAVHNEGRRGGEQDEGERGESTREDSTCSAG